MVFLSSDSTKSHLACLKSNMFVRLLLFGFVAFLVMLIASVNAGSMPQLWGPLYAIPFGDKVGHFVLMGTFAFLANLSLHCRTVQIKGCRVMLGTLIVFALVAAEEISQAFIPTRSCDAVDFVADAAGILAGSAVARACWRFRSKQNRRCAHVMR